MSERTLSVLDGSTFVVSDRLGDVRADEGRERQDSSPMTRASSRGGSCVNGEERQRDRTTSKIWNIDELIEYVVARTSLTTGDIMFTGTTAGVGLEDVRFLAPGDEIEAEIEGIGVLRNTVGPRVA